MATLEVRSIGQWTFGEMMECDAGQDYIARQLNEDWVIQPVWTFHTSRSGTDYAGYRVYEDNSMLVIDNAGGDMWSGFGDYVVDVLLPWLRREAAVLVWDACELPGYGETMMSVRVLDEMHRQLLTLHCNGDESEARALVFG